MTADDELMIKQWHEENERWCMFFRITHTKKIDKNALRHEKRFANVCFM
jgi:hypothetical protein